MLQVYGYSCFLPSRNFPLQQGLFIVPVQFPLNRIPAVKNKYPQKKHITYGQRILASNDEFEISKSAKIERLELVERLHSQNDIWKNLNSFYQFSRPHTVIGSVLGITSVCLLPLESIADLSPAFFVGLLKALIPSLAMNIYAVGLNQLFDVEIDKVNKPYLPLASGEFSMGFGITIVALSLLMSFGLGIMFKSPPLFSALLISFVLTSVYSVELPLLRWKSYPFLAATIIVVVRAILVQVCFFLHIQKYVLGRPVVFTKPLLFALSFMSMFSIVIALFKDIPDVDGDKEFGIPSFSISLGQERVFWICVSMLLMGYGSAVAIGVSSSFMLSKFITVLGHSSLAFILFLRAQSATPTDKASITAFYMFIWKLFYAEYFLIPFVR